MKMKKSAPAQRRAPRQHPVVEFFRRRAGVLLGFALFALLVHDIFGEHGFLALRRNQKEVEQLQQEIQQLNDDNGRLAREVEALKSDPRMIERIAREEMGLARPGELIFKLPPKPPGTGGTPAPPK